MKRTTLLPPLLLAGAILISSAIAVAQPHGVWNAVAALSVLILALLGVDAMLRRRAGGPLAPSGTAVLLAASLVLASWLVASRDPHQLAGFLPILGAVVATPLLSRRPAPHNP